MTLSTEDVTVIRRSWARAAQAGILAVDLFYGRLFEAAPEVRSLFASDMDGQKVKLIATLGFVVEHLDRPEEIGPAARALAVRHVGYGVRAEHYAPVGAALIWALEQLLGSHFGSAEADAWTRAYQALSADMIVAAYGEVTVE
ncbi:MAG: globin family protein [Pseudomonadota bacterium]